MKNVLRKTLAALSVWFLLGAGYFLIARPYQLRWGATKAETARAMPGDELDTNPTFLATRAITINAPAQKIWPWLIQMGFNRAGFYGYDIIEGIGSKSGLRSANTIVPDLQHPAVGDVIPISSIAQTRLYAIKPGEYLIWSETTKEKRNGAFTWALYPIDSAHTRLVSRIRWTHHWRQPKALALDVFTDLTDHLAVRKILKGIKARAEGSKIPSMTLLSAECFICLGVFTLFLVTFVRLLLVPFAMRAYWLCLATGIAWLVVWYAPFSF